MVYDMYLVCYLLLIHLKAATSNIGLGKWEIDYRFLFGKLFSIKRKKDIKETTVIRWCILNIYEIIATFTQISKKDVCI